MRPPRRTSVCSPATRRQARSSASSGLSCAWRAKREGGSERVIYGALFRAEGLDRLVIGGLGVADHRRAILESALHHDQAGDLQHRIDVRLFQEALRHAGVYPVDDGLWLAVRHNAGIAETDKIGAGIEI